MIMYLWVSLGMRRTDTSIRVLDQKRMKLGFDWGEQSEAVEKRSCRGLADSLCLYTLCIKCIAKGQLAQIQPTTTTGSRFEAK